MNARRSSDRRVGDGGTVLVTGGSGFIGSAVIDRLLSIGAGVVATTRRPADEAGSVRWERADVRSLNSMREVMRSTRPDIVFHLAAEVDGSRAMDRVPGTLETNLIGTVNCLIAAAEVGVRRIVMAGTLLQEPDSTVAPVPPAPYGAAKWAAAGYGRMFHALYGLPVVILRPSMVYGPGQIDRSKVVPYATTMLLRGEAPLLTSGAWRVDWVYIDDVADAICAAGWAPGVDGTTLDIGSGEQATVREVVRQLAAIVGGPAEPQFGALPERPLEPLTTADVVTTRAILGWSPRVSLADGLRRTVEWYREHD